ncbi:MULTISPECIES: nucleotidyltransferase family protein [Novacetimonas]|uniref:nucleotidyltransferase family protein n=1 Tax=Novacetimonas TaxID=2919364 RepID=UPI000789AEB9|nr:nucleotidyltransferase family protein [Novacetimonas hansenii]MBL7235712.1 nucleotidyltransferase family protein [Novacetimonas hansenii]PYD71505.1 hypothetical protein CFR74_14450 [Novacetimonas hansenii]RFP05120.1 hypothetical protein BGC30_00735 [Novacetimonas hansenii]WEQ59893.1 nucleotidyltransferase family protein [Novacetimonas hansenii]CUW46808.1 2-phospho-L-lactate guanylyltransferase [Novacetimonas hansenii]
MSTTSAGLNVLILAGSRRGIRDPMAQAAGISHKAILPVCGRPMITRVCDALMQVPGLGRVVVCIDSPDAIRDAVPPSVTFIPEAAGPSASVMNALGILGAPLLVTTADHALLRPEWITAFIADSTRANCDMSAGIALDTDIARDVPDTKRTMIRLADGAFSGCNLFFLRTPAAMSVLKLWQRLENDRKHPLRMARLLGLGILLRFVLRRLTRAAVCDRIGHLTGARVGLIPINDGRAAVDVDKPADLELVTRLIGQETTIVHQNV